jgi:DNA-directed RNA polymerase specialized sigma24 family protein
MSSPRPLDPDSPEVLVHEAARGDAGAFARIVRLHHGPMTRTALLVTGDLPTAARAVAEAWTAAWRHLADLQDPASLDAWLGSLAVDEALFLVRHGRSRDLEPMAAGRTGAPRDLELDRILRDLDPADRADLARHHLAGLGPSDLTRRPFQAAGRVQARLARLSMCVAGPLPAGLDLDAVDARARDRLRAHVDVPVPPVHADHATRRAQAEASLERSRRVSVAVCAVVGLLVALAPNLARLVNP